MADLILGYGRNLIRDIEVAVSLFLYLLIIVNCLLTIDYNAECQFPQ